MILTNDNHEVKPFPFMRMPGIKTWQAAHLNVWMPYFFLSYACKEEWTWVSQVMVIWREEDLLDFCDNVRADPLKKIYQIAKLIPPDPSETEIWRWKTIKEIWRGIGDHRSDEIFYFINDENSDNAEEKMMVKINPLEVERIFLASTGVVDR